MGRSTRGGRVWEGFGPDPYLAGVAMNSTVVGIQMTGVQTSSKHYIANEQETMRSSATVGNGTVIDASSSNVDDRTLHELYIWPFVSVEHNMLHPPCLRATTNNLLTHAL
jgi:beta-glucosidase